MGYDFRGIIASVDFIDLYRNRYRSLVIIPLINSLVAIPLTDDLFDEINTNKGITITNYEYLTDQIGKFCSEISQSGRTAYVEAEYFGGVGSQNGIVWELGEVIFEETLSNNAINKSLEILGVMRLKEKDEFDTARLGRHRFIDDWLNKETHL
ncbi:hypothetical protein [Paenibacillus sp. SAF-068]|uniref:hypothetical protein n=1 Tax=Paenibacillus sp. SAF-068 TaxID=3436864 RepID=UPI003F7D1980